MKQLNFIERAINGFKSSFSNKNSLGSDIISLPMFNKTGNTMVRDFGSVSMSERDYYIGYLYAAIRTRANRTAQLATESVKTQVKDNLEADDHLYLTIIDQSPLFSNYYFWLALSTFIDLKGVAYIYVLRNFNETIVGSPLEFKILNPYEISRVVGKDGHLAGYVETRAGFYREIPIQQMIEIRNFNPFEMGEGYAMTNAAKDSHFLNQQSGAYTRSALKKNVGQRGLITTEIVLEDEEYDNFKARVRESGGVENAGDFLFGNGPGSINYTDMQIDIDKLSLEKINNVSREELFAIMGMSKTIMGIEVSGTTRDTSKAQGDLFVQNQVIPQVQLIIDALNQDYRNNYVKEFASTPAIIYIDSPLKTDREAEMKDAEIMKVKADTAKVLIDAGFDVPAVLAEVGLEDMKYEKPEPPVIMPPADSKDMPKDMPKDEAKETVEELNTNAAATDGLEAVIKSKETSLENDIVNVQKQILQAVQKKVAKNQLTTEQEEDIITKTDKKVITDELAAVLVAFGIGTIALFANRTIRKRLEQFGLSAIFNMTADVEKTVKAHAKLSAESHMGTVLEEVYKTAREATEAGLSRVEIVAKINNLFADKVSKARATRIARTESNRLTAESQYQADKQFIDQNDLGQRAFKRWITRSADPCQYCEQLERETAANPIPFNSAFREIGDTVDVVNSDKQLSYVVGYEDVGAGTLHPNCSCIYEIIINKE